MLPRKVPELAPHCHVFVRGWLILLTRIGFQVKQLLGASRKVRNQLELRFSHRQDSRRYSVFGVKRVGAPVCTLRDRFLFPFTAICNLLPPATSTEAGGSRKPEDIEQGWREINEPERRGYSIRLRGSRNVQQQR